MCKAALLLLSIPPGIGVFIYCYFHCSVYQIFVFVFLLLVSIPMLYSLLRACDISWNGYVSVSYLYSYCMVQCKAMGMSHSIPVNRKQSTGNSVQHCKMRTDKCS